MRQQQKEAKEPVNNAFAQALAGLKTGITISLSLVCESAFYDGYSYLRNDVPGKIKEGKIILWQYRMIIY